MSNSKTETNASWFLAKAAVKNDNKPEFRKNGVMGGGMGEHIENG